MALERLGTEQLEIADVDSRHQRWCAESPHFAALPLHDHAGFLLGRSVMWTSRESLGREGSQGMATPVRLDQRTSSGMRSLSRARDRPKSSLGDPRARAASPLPLGVVLATVPLGPSWGAAFTP
jgi:hypothetical protein